MPPTLSSEDIQFLCAQLSAQRRTTGVWLGTRLYEIAHQEPTPLTAWEAITLARAVLNTLRPENPFFLTAYS